VAGDEREGEEVWAVSKTRPCESIPPETLGLIYREADDRCPSCGSGVWSVQDHCAPEGLGIAVCMRCGFAWRPQGRERQR